MEAQGPGYAFGVRGTELLVQLGRAAEVALAVLGPGLQDFAVPDAFERACLFEDRGNAARELQSLRVPGPGLHGIGDRVQLTEVVQHLRLAETVTQVAIEIQRLSLRDLSGQVIVGDVLGYAQEVERLSPASPVVPAPVQFPRLARQEE